MSVHSVMRWGIHKSVCLASSLAIAAAGVVAVPGAAQEAAAAEAVDTTKVVTCASYRAAEPTPEILGLTNVASNDAWGETNQLKWSAPYYYLFGTSEYNSNPNPFMVNGTNGVTPCVVHDASRAGGPTASLEAYAASDASKIVWDMLPDVVLGNNKGYNYNTAEYAQAAGEANGKSDYKVYGYGNGQASDGGVIYDSTNIFTMLDSMYDLAEAGKLAQAGTGKSLRYGDPVEIVANFEAYVKGAQGYVLSKIKSGDVKKKKVALVQNYDKESDTYKIIPTGVAEGTAASNRYLEAVQFVADNIADDGRKTETVGSGRDASTVATATKAEIADVDLVLVGSQAGSETLADTETIVSSLDTAVQKKTFWVNSANGSAGSCYGVVMNSVENAQNTGRILSCLYPEILDQSDMIAYYYQHFYHLNTGKLSAAIDNAMDGVRNWNADGSGTDATVWNESDVADYKEATVQKKLDLGMAYIAANQADLDASAGKYLPATAKYEASAYAKAAADNAKTPEASTTTKKAAQKLKISTSAKSVTYKKLKKAAQTTSAVKVTGAKTTVTFAKTGGSSKLSINSKTGKIKVKKNAAKKGKTLKIKVKATAKSSSKYKSASATATIKVKVK